MSQPVLSKVVTEVVGAHSADLLVRATSAATFRVDPTDYKRGDTSPGRFSGYRIVRNGTPLDAAARRKLATLLLDDRTYARDIAKAKCIQDVAIGVRAEYGGDSVELLFLFPCDRVVFLKRAAGDTVQTPGEYFDPAAEQVLAVLKAAFPHDAEVRAAGR